MATSPEGGPNSMLSVGDLLQRRYRILRPIGVGGMGAVYEAENILIRRRVAIKVMHGGALRNSEMSARFEREAQIVNLIDSEHVVEVLDLGHLQDGDPFIVMEYLDGQTLSEKIGSRGRMPATQLVPLLCQVLKALQSAHDAGVIHRDIKPDNIFLLSNRPASPDFVKLLDFGISKIGDTGDEPALTMTGATLGTPGYMAPEQIGSGNRVQPSADLYAVGVVLYRALTGRPPFSSDRINELLTQICRGGATPAHKVEASIDRELSLIVDKAMKVEPEQRYQSAVEMLKALTDWLKKPQKAASLVSAQPHYHNAPGQAHRSRADQTAPASVRASTLPPSVRSPGDSSRRGTPHWMILIAIATVGAGLALWSSSRRPAPRSASRQHVQVSVDGVVPANVSPKELSSEHLAANSSEQNKGAANNLAAAVATTPDAGAPRPTIGTGLAHRGNSQPADERRAASLRVSAGQRVAEPPEPSRRVDQASHLAKTMPATSGKANLSKQMKVRRKKRTRRAKKAESKKNTRPMRTPQTHTPSHVDWGY